ncbi:unnamed protein product [Dibothriocephalus latus]|uniref:Uncharacterized protein n=1 Tax=Dibothriocephalus latus TaxID=60516 RepID=A0A3P6S2Q3_DIBLA|nr:unnamed protein product [Dibothriocephalus latus]
MAPDYPECPEQAALNVPWGPGLSGMSRAGCTERSCKQMKKVKFDQSLLI